MATRLDLTTLSLQDALDLAALIEEEAYKRYTLFANQLGGHEAQLLVGDLLFWIVARAEGQPLDRLPEQLIQSIAVER